MTEQVFRSQDHEPGVYTIDEIAARLKVHRDTVRAEIRRGRLKAARVGNRPRITEKQLADYLALAPGDEVTPRRRRRAS